MALSRYQVIDAYTLEELRRQYNASDAQGRIRLLAKFRKTSDERDSKRVQLPFEIVRLAAEDNSAEVRQWIARNGCFEDQDWQNRLNAVPDPIDAVVNHLKIDPDPFVRACLHENRAIFSKPNADAAFRAATHLERLALVRNPEVVQASELIQKLFDLANTDLGIDLEQRRELALAFVSNPEAQRDSHWHADVSGLQEIAYGNDWALYESSNHWAAIWGLTAKWPIESEVGHAVFENIFMNEVVKAEVYQHCKDANLRFQILEACDSTEVQILNLGIKDSDRFCRSAAFSKVPRWFYDKHASEFEAILSSDHKDALSGFVRNESLPVETLKRVGERLEALGDDFGKHAAQRTINRIERKQSPQASNGSGDSSSRVPREEGVPRRGLNRRFPFVILLVAGAFLLLGAPLALTLGFGLIGTALTFLFMRRPYPEPGKPRVR
jgi:hypothetical protein